MMNIEIVKEIRFAVVMYGGVSLAIYINGVAQELLRMVRLSRTFIRFWRFQHSIAFAGSFAKSVSGR